MKRTIDVSDSLWDEIKQLIDEDKTTQSGGENVLKAISGIALLVVSLFSSFNVYAIIIFISLFVSMFINGRNQLCKWISIIVIIINIVVLLVIIQLPYEYINKNSWIIYVDLAVVIFNSICYFKTMGSFDFKKFKVILFVLNVLLVGGCLVLTAIAFLTSNTNKISIWHKYSNIYNNDPSEIIEMKLYNIDKNIPEDNAFYDPYYIGYKIYIKNNSKYEVGSIKFTLYFYDSTSNETITRYLNASVLLEPNESTYILYKIHGSTGSYNFEDPENQEDYKLTCLNYDNVTISAQITSLNYDYKGDTIYENSKIFVIKEWSLCGDHNGNPEQADDNNSYNENNNNNSLL